jgi:aspartyl-tRNA(Asn)/glutamyl-tRNA(Gln) amidotransferase subunit A
LASSPGDLIAIPRHTQEADFDMLGKDGVASARLGRVLDQLATGNAQGARAYTNILQDTAHKEAVEADRRAHQSKKIGALDGALVSIKSMLDVQGLVTDAGSATLRGRQPALRDSSVVAKLREAGAVVVGTTQMTEFAFSAVGANPNFAELGNPHDPKLICGGSSSGAAVSIGEGLADIAIGSDTGGSLRIPAALCGLVGFKPTASRVSAEGNFPLSQTLDSIGPIARTVRHCGLADAVLSGGKATDVVAMGIVRFRLIIGHGRLFDDCDQEVRAAFDDAIDLLKRSGVRVTDGALDSTLDELARIDQIGTFPPVELAATLRACGIEDLADVDPNTRARIEAGSGLSAIDYIEMGRLRDQLAESFEWSMDHNDVYVVPTVPIVAPSIASIRDPDEFKRVNALLLRNPRVANLLDCPSISIPIPSSGLPVGMMLIGRRNADLRLLSIALRLEELLDRDSLLPREGDALEVVGDR